MGRVRVGPCAATVLILLGAIVSCSCSSDRHCDPKVVYPNRETPQGLVDFFSKSLEEKSISHYGEALGDTYRFDFLPEDWDSGHVTPDHPYWARAEDLTHTGVMFGSPLVLEIKFALQQVGDFSGPDTLLLGTFAPDIKVTVQWRTGEEDRTYWVNASRSRLLFWMRRDPRDARRWVIREIKEENLPLASGAESSDERAALAVMPSSFGSIKVMFQ